MGKLDKRDDSMHIGGSITDELRSWAVGNSLRAGMSLRTVRDQALAIADRIDAEHEAKVSYWQGASYKDGYDEGFASADDWLAQHEDAMAEHGWVRLPVDADGVPFHIGELVDEMLPFGGYAAPAPIDTMELSRGASGYGWMVKLDAENRASISPSLLRHHHAPTVEDVLHDFICDHEEGVRDEVDLIAEYAKRLTLTEDVSA